MKSDKKLILTDVDGVLLDWAMAFNLWAENNGYSPLNNEVCIFKKYGLTRENGLALIEKFHETKEAGKLTPTCNAEHFIPAIAEKGWRFVAVTSVSENFKAKRLSNLEFVFGKNIFDKIYCVGTLCDKSEILNKYKNVGAFWVDDLLNNIIAGHTIGLKCFWMNNTTETAPHGIKKVSCWSEILEYSGRLHK